MRPAKLCHRRRPLSTFEVISAILSEISKVKVNVKCVYIAPSRETSGIDHTVLPAITFTPMPAFTSQAFTKWRLPRLRLRTSNCSLLHIYLPRKDERLSRPGWLTYSGRFAHISGHHLSTAGRGQDRESSPVKDQRSTAVPRNLLYRSLAENPAIL